MPTLVPIPKLGQSEETVTIEKWRVSEGDKISKGDVLFEVETDKAVLEVESQFEGTLLKIVIPEGREIPVMSTAAVLGEPGEEIPEIEQPKMPEKKEASKRRKPKPGLQSREKTKAAENTPKPEETRPETEPEPEKLRPSPRARKFAEDYLIDLDKVPGSGPGGRVIEKDVKAYLEDSGYRDIKITPAALKLAKKESLNLLEIEGADEDGRLAVEDIREAASEKPREFSAMRATIARRLTESKQTVPHFYVTVSIDMTDLMKRRSEHKKDGVSYGVNSVIIKAAALTLKDFPMLNAETDGKSISYKSRVNIGVAVSLENGLVVPVLRDADRKTLPEIQEESADLAEKARKAKLGPGKMRGGTFTISNMGMLGVENFAAIINPGETGILAVSSILDAPLVKEGKVTARKIMKMTLSADHRAVDGADGAKFMNALKEKLENAGVLDTWI